MSIRGLPILTFMGSAVTDTDGSSRTFSACAIGTASTTRLVILLGAGSNNSSPRTLNSATIGGITSTIHSQGSGGGGLATGFICSAIVPTGTTADIIVTFSSTQSNFGIGWWTLDTYNSATPVDTDLQGNADPKTITITTSQGGVVVAYRFNSGQGTCTWTNVTERFDENVGTGPSTSHSGGDVSNVAGGSLGVTSDYSTSSDHRPMVVGSWR